MATLAEIRDAVKATLEARIDRLTVYDTVPAVISPPAVVVTPRSASFERGMGRGVDDTYLFDLVVLCSFVMLDQGQDNLDDYLTGAGPRSLREALHAGGSHHDLGLPDTKAWISGWSGYGTAFSAGSVEYVSAAGQLTVVTSAAR